jgi:hypothetical protein
MNFVKEARFTSAQDGGEYTSYAYISCDYAKLLELNGNSISNYSYVLNIGKHYLKAYGEGGYEKEITFIVKPPLTRVVP